MKYIIVQGEDGIEFPVFCVAPQTHADMAAAWRRSPARKIVAAGFCAIASPTKGGGEQMAVATYGHSESLGLGPRQEDASLIAALVRSTANMVPDFLSNANCVTLP